MKKMVKAFSEPMEEKTMSNYVDSEVAEDTIKNHRNVRERYVNRMHRIESADVPERGNWWHDPGYDMQGNRIPDQDAVAVIEEFDADVNQRFIVNEDGGWDVNAFPEDEAKWNKDIWSGIDIDFDSEIIGEAFWDLLDTYVEEDIEPGTYQIKCYIDLVFEIDEVYYNQDGSIDEYSRPKLNLNDSTIKDIEITKIG